MSHLRSWRYTWLLALLVAFHPTSAYAQSSAESRGNFPSYPYPVGSLHPDFAAPDQDDEVFRLSEQRGKVVLLHMCALWCGACRDSAVIEAMLTNDLNQVVGEDNWVLVDGLFQNNQGLPSDQTDAQNWRQFLGTPARTLHAADDGNSELHTLGNQIPSFPTYAVIGKNGHVTSIIVGFTLTTTPRQLEDAVSAAWFDEIFQDGFDQQPAVSTD